MAEALGALGAFIVAVMGAVTLFYKTYKSVGEANVVAINRRVEILERQGAQQQRINTGLTNWQLRSREVIRHMGLEMVAAGVAFSDNIRTMLIKLDEDLAHGYLEEEEARTDGE